MAEKSKKTKLELELTHQLVETVQDLQRTRADFENFRKRYESEMVSVREAGQTSAILRLLPVIDNIERAISHIPDDLKENTWAQGVAGIAKNLDRSLEHLHLKRIDAKPGTPFNPDLHEAILMDEDAKGEHEVIESEMQAGYMLNGRPIRHAMVKVTRH
jgi:molecular chaperone GrpE